MSPEPDPLLRRILDEAPGSIRALAREAGRSHVLLTKIRDGERRMTDRTRKALAGALRRWGQQCDELATELENAGGNDHE